MSDSIKAAIVGAVSASSTNSTIKEFSRDILEFFKESNIPEFEIQPIVARHAIEKLSEFYEDKDRKKLYTRPRKPNPNATMISIEGEHDLQLIKLFNFYGNSTNGRFNKGSDLILPGWKLNFLGIFQAPDMKTSRDYDKVYRVFEIEKN